MVLDFGSQLDYIWALLPEIVLSLWAMLVLMVDVFQKGNREGPSTPLVAWSRGSLLLGSRAIHRLHR